MVKKYQKNQNYYKNQQFHYKKIWFIKNKI